jgi:hypothetical protein
MVARLNRMDIQIQSKFEARGGQAPPHPHPHLHLPAHGQWQVEMPLDSDRSLDMERAAAFELTRAPSPPLVIFRIDSDSRSDVIKSRASILFFFLNFRRLL